ncbi:glycosyltransferase family 4 protein [Microbacterium sp. AG238]|uniref:glycosyltransferase family 4 protein n=1 Tax=Microbacterium sp. AG238 TaxID=2183994 RepID=UPI0016005F19|nr:glycosyltransferase family 4 protein [Microbacterium sp. AG238]
MEPIDPRKPKPGGIDTCIRGLLKYHPENMELRLVGIDSTGDTTLGEWREETIDGRRFWYLPVYRGDNTVIRPRVPHVVSLVLGTIRHRRKLAELGSYTLQTHRVTTGLGLRKALRPASSIQFVHNDGDDSITLGDESYFKRARRLFAFMERAAVRASQDVVVFNRAAASRLSAWGGHVRFSPTWYDDEYFYPADPPPAERTSMVWVGRFEATKDPLLAIHAMSSLPPDYQLTMIGGGSLLEHARTTVDDLGLAERVRIIGPVSKQEVAERLRSSELLLMTSQHEGFPRAVVEALASGLPVVTTAGGEPNGLVREAYNGTRISKRSAAAVADAVLRAAWLTQNDARESVAQLSASSLVPYVLTPSRTQETW